MDVLVNVAGQKLRIATNFKSITGGSRNFVRFCFCLGGEWNGLRKTAQFSQIIGGITHAESLTLDAEDKCYLPDWVESGECWLSLYGTGENNMSDDVIATTEAVMIRIGPWIFDEESVPPDSRAQILSLITDLVDRVSALEEGELTGPITWEMLAEAVQNKIRDPDDIGLNQLSSELRTWLNTLESNVSTAQQSVASLGSEIDSVRRSVSGLSGTVTAHGGKINALESAVATNTGNITGLQTSVTGINSSISQNSSKIRTLELELAETNHNLSELTDDYILARSRVDDIEDLLGSDGWVDMDKLDPDIKTSVELLAGFPIGRIFDVQAAMRASGAENLRTANYDDDGDVIQNLIEAAAVQQGFGNPGAVIYFAPGVYKITHTIFYYSNMVFVFAKGAQIYRASNSYDAIIPGDVFSNWFNEDFTSLATATSSGSYKRRFSTQNVAFIGGDFYGDPDATNGDGVKKGPAMIGMCHARNVRVSGCSFHGNRGAHCIEINSSDFVEVEGCHFYGYVADSSPGYSEMVQIDAASNTGYGSKLSLTVGTREISGQTFKVYTNDDNTSKRTVAGYFKSTRIAGNMTDRAGRMLADMQCCHNVQIHNNFFETNTGATAVGDHLTGDAAVTSVSAPTYNSSYDLVRYLKIYNNHFYGPGNSAAGQSYRGVISLGEACTSVDIYENVFENSRTAVTYDVAIGSRSSRADYRVFRNRYVNFPTPSWEETGSGGGGTMATLTINEAGGTTKTYDGSGPVTINVAGADNTVESVAWADYITTGGASPFTPPWTPSARIYVKNGRLYGHVRFGNNSTDAIQFFGSTHITKFAHINQSYRPHTGDTIQVDAPITGWAREANSGAYHPVAGYISAGSSTSAMQLICDSTANMQAVVLDFEYAL